MAEPTQFSFDLKEVAAALIKEQNIHEGLWTIAFEISMGAGLFGPNPAEAKPGAFMHITKVQLLRQNAATPETSNTVDATVVNPAP
jgi:hypothetical protein